MLNISQVETNSLAENSQSRSPWLCVSTYQQISFMGSQGAFRKKELYQDRSRFF